MQTQRCFSHKALLQGCGVVAEIWRCCPGVALLHKYGVLAEILRRCMSMAFLLRYGVVAKMAFFYRYIVAEMALLQSYDVVA